MLFIISITTIAAYIYDTDNKYTENPTNYYNTGGSLYGPSVSEHPFDSWQNSPHGDLGIVGHLYEHTRPDRKDVSRTNANHWMAKN